MNNKETYPGNDSIYVRFDIIADNIWEQKYAKCAPIKKLRCPFTQPENIVSPVGSIPQYTI